MSVTLTIDESLLRNAEQATNIHDWSTLVTKGLQALCQPGPSAPTPSQAPFDFDDALAAAAALPDLSEEEFDRLAKEMNAPMPPAW